MKSVYIYRTSIHETVKLKSARFESFLPPIQSHCLFCRSHAKKSVYIYRTIIHESVKLKCAKFDGFLPPSQSQCKFCRSHVMKFV